MDRTHFEKADQQCHKISFKVESKGEKKERTTEEHLEQTLRG